MKFLILYNPMSGRANFRRYIPQVKKIFEKSSNTVDFYESKAPKDLIRTAKDFSSSYDVFLAAGGDGTINEVVNGIMNSKDQPILGVLPSGTANDIAAILGINRSIKRSLNMFFNEEPVKLDVNQINDQYFIYTTASGMLSKISYDVSRRRIKKYGYLAYVIEAMQDISKDYRYPITICYNGKEEKYEVVMVLGLNSNRVGGVRLINFSNSKLNDGLFELRLFLRAKSFWRFRFLQSFIRGGKRIGDDVQIAASKFEIKTNPDVRWNADGEYSTNGSIVIQTHKEAIYVFVSKRIKNKYFMHVPK
ncbi:MAG: diacylglycerol kinase family protein [Acholeplasmataceae bacterium]